MNILIAPDKFKGTLSAMEVCNAIERGLNRSLKDVSVQKFPLADGGEGTLEIFQHFQKGILRDVVVHDPLLRKIKSRYALSGDGKIAFIEMARVSGLSLLKTEERNPLLTTTLGMGELIRDALQQGVKQIILGIGGSATNDASLGAFCALGGKLFNAQGRAIEPCGKNLADVHHIDSRELDPRLKSISITAICDVKNPFYGTSGAAFVYAPQKGANLQAVERLDEGLKNIAKIILNQTNIDVQSLSGAGAGGGFAGGAFALFGAELKPGIEVVFSITHFQQALSWADIVITGEGKIDAQTLQGKVVAGVLGHARKQQKKVLAVCGQVDLTEKEFDTLGIDSIYSLAEWVGIDRALTETAIVLEDIIAKRVGKFISQQSI